MLWVIDYSGDSDYFIFTVEETGNYIKKPLAMLIRTGLCIKLIVFLAPI